MWPHNMQNVMRMMSPPSLSSLMIMIVDAVSDVRMQRSTFSVADTVFRLSLPRARARVLQQMQRNVAPPPLLAFLSVVSLCLSVSNGLLVKGAGPRLRHDVRRQSCMRSSKLQHT